MLFGSKDDYEDPETGKKHKVFDWNRCRSAAITGLVLRAPMQLYVYRFMNPLYMKYFIPWLFPIWTKGWEAVKWKRTLASVVMDTYVLKFLNNAIYIMGTEMIESKGNFEQSFALLKKSYTTQLLVAWCYYTPYKILLYGFIPLYMRNIAAAAISITWGIIFSFMQHMRYD